MMYTLTYIREGQVRTRYGFSTVEAALAWSVTPLQINVHGTGEQVWAPTPFKRLG